jgi:hypothetical protein
VRPALKSGLLPVWRDRDTLQIGIDPRRAVALTGMSQAGSMLSLLDGSRDRDQVIAAAAERGIPAQTADRIITLLAAGGALDDFPASTLRALPRPVRRRLAAELATVSLARGDGDGGARSLARRHAAQVHIYGPGRIGPAIASILDAAGVGLITRADNHAPDNHDNHAADPGAGPRPAARPPAGTTVPGGTTVLADLAIVTAHQAPETPPGLMADRVPHLAASASEAIGVVGPLVLPGRTACLRCLDHARADKDPAWPLILAQLAARQPDPPACDAVLATAVAAQAAAQALAFIDRTPEVKAVINGTLELVLPAWQWRRRTWRPHMACACGSSGP